MRKFNPAARLTLPEMIEMGRLAQPESADEDADAAPPVATLPPAAQEGEAMEGVSSMPRSHLSEDLGFVPGSRAKNPAELKERMARVRAFYATLRPEGQKEGEQEPIPSEGAEPAAPPISKKRAKKEREASEKKEKKKQKKNKKKKSLAAEVNPRAVHYSTRQQRSSNGATVQYCNSVTV